MPPWLEPQQITDDPASRFPHIAEHLLNACSLHIAGERCCIVEIECYYHAPHHPDPFVHCDTLQKIGGRWYFHRNGGSYRGGSFKGVDLTFGNANAFAGILIRAIERADGSRIDGPSLTVDYLLRQCGYTQVAELANAIGERAIEDSRSPLYLESQTRGRDAPLIATARVGLRLPSGCDVAARWPYLFRPYRFLVDPQWTTKGRDALVIALYLDGHDAPTIAARTRCPLPTVRQYLVAFQNGFTEQELAPLLMMNESPLDRCRLQGRWHREFAIS